MAEVTVPMPAKGPIAALTVYFLEQRNVLSRQLFNFVLEQGSD